MGQKQNDEEKKCFLCHFADDEKIKCGEKRAEVVEKEEEEEVLLSEAKRRQRSKKSQKVGIKKKRKKKDFFPRSTTKAEI